MNFEVFKIYVLKPVILGGPYKFNMFLRKSSGSPK